MPPFDAGLLDRMQPDSHWVVRREGKVAARASLWFRETLAPLHAGRAALIGHFAAVDAAGAASLLAHLVERARLNGCGFVAGPLDRDTWHSYRLVVEPSTEPPFFLEPANPPDWPSYFRDAGFSEAARYFSGLNGDLDHADERIPAAEARLAKNGVVIRSFDVAHFDDEIRRIFDISVISFASNLLYTPVGWEEFRAMYEPLRGRLDPRFVLLAEHGGKTVGYVFALPDFAQLQAGRQVDRAILKTVAVLPGRAWAGLGAVLVEQIHRIARQSGYRSVIHALMHESNNSLNISAKTAVVIRRYALFGRSL
jgi:GNAT superfamily N-acetyltransferase